MGAKIRGELCGGCQNCSEKLNTDRLCSKIGGWNLLQPSILKIVGRRY